MSDNWQAGYAGVTAVVLGASGFIGRWVARYLTAAGAELSLVVRDAATAQPIFDAYDIAGEVHILDLRDRAALARLYQGVRPAISFNLAGYGVDRAERDERLAYQINGELPGKLARLAAKTQDPGWAGQAVVHVGSALEYGTIPGDLAETSIPHPTTLYGRSKLAGTLALAAACRAADCAGLTARLFTIYGPGEHDGRLLPSLLETSASPRPLPLTNGRQKRDFTYVEDVAEGLLRLGLATVAPGAIINLTTGRLTSVRRFIETAADVLGIPGDCLQFGALPTRPEEQAHDDVNTDRLVRLSGWRPTTGIATGVRRTAVLSAGLSNKDGPATRQ